jgi:hypothetical protein
LPLNRYEPLSTITVPACGIYYLDVDTTTLTSLQVDTIVTYAQTSSTTGISLNLRYSAGTAYSSLPQEWIVYNAEEIPSDPAYALFSTSYTPVALEPIGSSSSSQEKQITSFNIDVKRIPRWLRFELINNDTAYSATVLFKFDL